MPEWSTELRINLERSLFLVAARAGLDRRKQLAPVLEKNHQCQQRPGLGLSRLLATGAS